MMLQDPLRSAELTSVVVMVKVTVIATNQEFIVQVTMNVGKEQWCNYIERCKVSAQKTVSTVKNTLEKLTEESVSLFDLSESNDVANARSA